MPDALAGFLALCLVLPLATLAAPSNETEADRGHRNETQTNAFNVVVPAHAYDLILTRPEKNSVCLSVLAYQDMEGFVTYGLQADACSNQTPVRLFPKGSPVELVLGSLQGDTEYF